MVYGEITKGVPPLRRPKLSKKAQEKEDKIKIYMKLIVIGMIGKSNYIGTSLSWSIQKVKSKGKKPIQFLQKKRNVYHWVSHSKLKELDINDFFEGKQMIENLEAELTGALKETSNTEDFAVAKEANMDEAITAKAKAINEMEIYLKDGQKTKAYEEKMNIDDKNMNTIENRNKVYTK